MIPAIDLMEGLAVFLTAGRPETMEIVSEDPVGLAKSWQARGAKRLHLVDLDAALGLGENRDLVRAVLRGVTIPVQVGGGLRDEDRLREILSSGAARAVVGTRAVESPEWLREMAARFPSRLILAVDRDPRGVLVEGWTKTASKDAGAIVRLANRLPLDGVLFTNVGIEGRLEGVGDPTDHVVARCTKPRIAAGGVTSVEDLRRLRRAGYDHAVVGKALYSGTLDLRAAEEAMA